MFPESSLFMIFFSIREQMTFGRWSAVLLVTLLLPERHRPRHWARGGRCPSRPVNRHASFIDIANACRAEFRNRYGGGRGTVMGVLTISEDRAPCLPHRLRRALAWGRYLPLALGWPVLLLTLDLRLAVFRPWLDAGGAFLKLAGNELIANAVTGFRIVRVHE